MIVCAVDHNRNTINVFVGKTMFTSHSSKKDSEHWDDHSREVIKEGLVNYVSVCELDDSKWEKCRMVLVKTKTASLLEFYSPSDRAYPPKCGMFCFLINEVRQTKQLEMPEKPCTFVIRVSAKNNNKIDVSEHNFDHIHQFSNLIEYIVETESYEDLFDWLRTIKEQTIFANTDDMDAEPGPPSMDMDDPGHVHPNAAFAMLENYPWFHRNISRFQANDLVLRGGEEWSGVFLLRQSETRNGECVLTFNFKGNAKHLRILVQPDGRCTMETSLCFPSIFKLLENFRSHSIRMKHDRKLVLTDFVIFAGNTNHRKSCYGVTNMATMATTTVKTSARSVRITKEELKSMIDLLEN